jgi:hypothetical protein
VQTAIADVEASDAPCPVIRAEGKVSEIVAPLFGSEDLRNAVRSFLEEGLLKATFAGP